MTDVVKEPARNVWAIVDYGPIAVGDVFVSELLARAADVHAGRRVLDVGAGTGNSALSAARRGAVVTALDVVPAALATAARRAEAEGLALATEVADAGDLPFEDDSFDIVLSSFGCMYAPDHARTAAELVRVCRPGGRIALASWTPTGLTARLQKVLAGAMRPPGAPGGQGAPGGPDGPGGRPGGSGGPGGPQGGPPGKPPVMWGDEAYVRKLFGDRISSVRADILMDEWVAASAEAQVDLLEQHLPPWHAAQQRLPQGLREKVRWAAIAELRAANRVDDGTLVAPAEYLQFIATVA